MSKLVRGFSLRLIQGGLRSSRLSRVMLRLLAVCALACMTAGPALAATTTYWWDPAPNTTNYANWDTADMFWNTSGSAAATPNAAWVSSSSNPGEAVFSNAQICTTSGGTANLTISTTATGIDVVSGNMTISASTNQVLQITSSGVQVAAGAGLTFDSSLGTLQWLDSREMSNSGPIVINSVLSNGTGNNPTFETNGSGNVTFGPTCSIQNYQLHVQTGSVFRAHGWHHDPE